MREVSRRFGAEDEVLGCDVACVGGMHIAPLIARTESLHLGEALRVVTLGVHVIGHEDALRFEQIGVFFIVHLGPFPWV